MNRGAAWRAWLGHAAVMALLALAAGGLLRLHADTAWWPGTALRWQWQAALGSVLAYAALCGVIWWRVHPRRPTHAGGVPLLVAWASQTGFAAELAERSVGALRASGVAAQSVPLQSLDADTLRAAARVLFVVSTTGEGDPPDHAVAFLRRTQPRIDVLPNLRYGMLALGDRSYDDFCAFGRQLDEWLSRHGAHTLFDRVEVDNADPGALRHWQYLLGQFGDGIAQQPDWARPRYHAWQLHARERTNPGCDHGAVFRLSLQPADGQWPAWQAGDIAEIGPRHADLAVSRFLAANHLDGDRLVHGEALRDWIARSQWQEVTDAALERWVDALQPLPHREYSIASIPAERRLDLLVRRQRGADGQPGLGSGWLCEHAPVGGAIALRLRANPGFHPPADTRPLILIGNGTGIAGLRAHLAVRIAAGGARHWLLFGERHAAHDNHFADDLRRWQQAGEIERLDMVFSRDGGRHRYVQDALAEAAADLRAWVDAGASLYVCGSLRGMAPAVDAVLEQVLGRETRETLLLEGRYRRDVY